MVALASGSSVSIASKPPKLVLSGNPVIYKILAGNYLASAGAKAQFTISLTAEDNPFTPFDENRYAEITFNLKSLKTKVVKGVGVNAWDGYPSKLAEYLNTNPLFVDLFEISSEKSGGKIHVTFKAKHPGNESPVISYFYNNQTWYFNVDHTVQGIDIVKNSLHRVHAAVIAGSVIKLDSQARTPDSVQNPSIGQANFNLSGLLQKDRTGHFTFPEPENRFFIEHDILDKISTYFYESWGVPTQKSQVVYSEDFYVLQGKLNTAKQAELNDLQKSFYSEFVQTGKFLTDQPAVKTTDIYAPERLYYFVHKAFSATLKITYYYTDGSTETKTTDVEQVNANTIVEIPTGYKKIRLTTKKTILKYDVQVFSGAISVSPKQTYFIDRNYYYFARYFFIRNKYGVYDLIRTTGKASKKRKVSKQSVNVSLPDNFTSTDREFRQVSSKTQIQYSLNTGFLKDSPEVEWVAELFESTDVFWLKKGKAYPVAVLDSENLVYKDAEQNNYLEFDVVHANGDDIPEEFSALEPIEIIGDYNYDYNTDYLTGSSSVPVPNPDPEPEPTPTTQTLFQSDFSTWVASTNPIFPSQPINTVISNNGRSTVSATNDNNRLKLINNISGTGSTNEKIDFKSNGKTLALLNATENPVTYKITVMVDELEGYTFIEGVRNDKLLFMLDNWLVKGLNEFTVTLAPMSMKMPTLNWHSHGLSIISNIKIEKQL